MTHQSQPVPPLTLWPSPTGPHCPVCRSADQTVWLGTLDHEGATVLRWVCHTCCAEFAIPATCWPVLDGPDCPVCETPATRWQAIDPDHAGDLWECEAGHEFVLDPEGFVYDVPGAS